MNTTVIYHSADFDGIFCREIARKFLGDKDVEYIGWNFGDPKISMPAEGAVYILDLPPECLCDNPALEGLVWARIIWIDHHKTSIEKWPASIAGYRIDGVAACRLMWQWFTRLVRQTIEIDLPEKEHFVNREVYEPLAVLLAGEYDVWDKRDLKTDVFQYGLRSCDPDFQRLLSDDISIWRSEALQVCDKGYGSLRYAQHVDAGNMHASFLVEWEGLKFLALNGRGNSLTFASKDIPETGHDALLMFYYNGKGQWVVSLYHAAHRKDIDLSTIAVKHSGGGHKGACGFTCKSLPFHL
ncbi:MAG: hypothetical protein WCJ35_17390 [Planctomycetota bacterium]